MALDPIKLQNTYQILSTVPRCSYFPRSSPARTNRDGTDSEKKLDGVGVEPKWRG